MYRVDAKGGRKEDGDLYSKHLSKSRTCVVPGARETSNHHRAEAERKGTKQNTEKRIRIRSDTR